MRKTIAFFAVPRSDSFQMEKLLPPKTELYAVGIGPKMELNLVEIVFFKVMLKLNCTVSKTYRGI